MVGYRLPEPGSRLKAYRKKKDFSRTQLEAITGVSASTIRRYEAGYIKSLHTLDILCQGIGIPLSHVFIDADHCKKYLAERLSQIYLDIIFDLLTNKPK